MKLLLILSTLCFFTAAPSWAGPCHSHKPMTRAEFIAKKGKANCRDLSGVDLSNLELQEVELKGSILAGTNLQHSYFFRVNARYADFSGAFMENVWLSSVDGHNSDFSNVNAENARFEGIWIDSNFEGFNGKNASFSSTSFDNSNMTNADFSNAYLVWARFNKANLRNSQFVGAEVVKSFFGGADLTNADFSAARVTRTKFKKYMDSGQWIPQATMEGVDMTNADFTCWTRFGESNWKSVDFNKATYSETLSPKSLQTAAPSVGMTPNNHDDNHRCS